MRCPKCGLHSAVITSVLTSSPPTNVYQCVTEGCKHTWQVKDRWAREPDPNALSLEERVELLERLVFSLCARETHLNLPAHDGYDGHVETLLKEQYVWECVNKAKGCKG